jgi:hypothetical protein
MAGDVQIQTRNLEQKVGGSKLLDGMKRMGQTAKKYATIAVIGAALAIGGAGCGEESECCKELSCNGYNERCENHYDDTCACVYDPSSKYATQEFGLTMDDVFENDVTTYDGN